MHPDYEAPKRPCTGGPHAREWCGRDAIYVCTDPDGLQWFACAEHTEGQHTTPIAFWFEWEVGRRVLAPDAFPLPLVEAMHRLGERVLEHARNLTQKERDNLLSLRRTAQERAELLALFEKAGPPREPRE